MEFDRQGEKSFSTTRYTWALHANSDEARLKTRSLKDEEANVDLELIHDLVFNLMGSNDG